MTTFTKTDAIRFEGPDSTNTLAFKAYDKDRPVLGKPMAAWLRLAAAYGPSVAWSGKEWFGDGTLPRPWLGPGQEKADARCAAAFGFFARLGVPYFTFLDHDAIAEPSSLAEHRENLERIAETIAAEMQASGVKLLWGGANLYEHPRYAAGAATNPDPEVFAYAAAQVRFMLETTHRLGGEAYTVLSHREGYDTLLNTDLKAELDRLGRFLAMVVEHKHRIGFKGPILIEPKPFEPLKAQYGRDVATVFAFLQRYDLLKDVKVSVEVNNATLAGLDFEHEIASAQILDVLGSIDVNRGDPRTNWNTAQFPHNALDLTPAMVLLLEAGGLPSGGFNIDARIRRQSVDPDDLVIAHVAAIDVVAEALLAAEKIVAGQRLAALKAERYAGWKGELGQAIATGTLALDALADLAIARNLDPKPVSGRQELAEAIVAGS
ncbi:xylose isomerase [Rhizomicrobium electricum]|uniref:Xylose isomerase n=1 Tax=Rhizomicrobium electricum TaxID=480070 RepID=A0ABN1F0V9_9PROT|nr:xylose isomerase [Rhizomicrobium electricum]NIJ50222.1 xylose isomerase [Rhizomicrobium electricum]